MKQTDLLNRIAALSSDAKSITDPILCYVDFETVSDLYDDFSKIPEKGGQPLIFMIGCGHVQDGEWVFRCFTADALSENGEADIIDAWLVHMRETKKQLTTMPDEPLVFHWSHAEVATLETAYNSATA